MTEAERKLLQDTARVLIRTQETLDGMQSVLRALYGNSKLALSRLRVERDLRRLQGKEARYLCAFIDSVQ